MELGLYTIGNIRSCLAGIAHELAEEVMQGILLFLGHPIIIDAGDALTFLDDHVLIHLAAPQCEPPRRHLQLCVLAPQDVQRRIVRKKLLRPTPSPTKSSFHLLNGLKDECLASAGLLFT